MIFYIFICLFVCIKSINAVSRWEIVPIALCSKWILPDYIINLNSSMPVEWSLLFRKYIFYFSRCSPTTFKQSSVFCIGKVNIDVIFRDAILLYTIIYNITESWLATFYIAFHSSNFLQIRKIAVYKAQ